AEDGSEWFNLGSPDMPAFFASVTQGVPLPAQAGWNPLQQQLFLPGKRMQATFIRANAVRYALCRWAESKPSAARGAAVKRLAAPTFSVSGRDGKQHPVPSSFVADPAGTPELHAYAGVNCGTRWRLAGAVR